jgi:precorrin-2 dehydrogenase/sirohydrochlorin ferrochelatase
VTKEHPHYPIFLDVEGREVLVVGGGAVSERKIDSLLRCGARVVVVSPETTARIDAWARDARLTLRRRFYEPSDIDGAMLVVASTSDGEVNGRVAADCRAKNVLVNVADNPALCDFIVPAVIESGSMQVAVSTGGSSPALARRLKADLQRTLGNEYAEVNTILGSLREGAKTVLPHDSDRKRFFDSVIATGVLDLLRAGQRREAYEAVAAACRDAGVPLSERVAQELARP